MVNKRILILTGKAGQGHLSVATALDFWSRKFGYNSEVLDIIPAGNDRIYQLMMKVPPVHAAFFRSTNNTRIAELMTRGLNYDFNRKVKRFSPLCHQADAVFSTHPLIHPTLGRKKVIFILDPEVHISYLTEPTPDYYYVLWEESLNQIKKLKTPKDKICLGVPLAREPFYQVGKRIKDIQDKGIYKIKLKLNQNIPLGLIIAGGNWIEKIEPYLNHLVKAFPPASINLAFICGKKKAFAKAMSKKYPKSNFLFLDWLDEKQMADWMGAADFAVALTLAQMAVEAGLCRVPIYIYDLIEGQEEKYRQVIEGHRVGKYIAGSPEKQIDQLKRWLPNNTKAFNRNLSAWQKHLLSGPEFYCQFLKKIVNGSRTTQHQLLPTPWYKKLLRSN